MLRADMLSVPAQQISNLIRYTSHRASLYDIMANSYPVALILFLTSTVAQKPLFIELHVFVNEIFCLDELVVFDVTSTVNETINFTLSKLKANILNPASVKPVYELVMGCDIRQSLRGAMLLTHLQAMKAASLTNTFFTVFIGPPLNGDCDYISDWFLRDSPLTATSSLYQVEYCCLMEYAVRESMGGNSFQAHNSLSPAPKAVSANLGVLTSSIVDGLHVYLRSYNWRHVLIMFETSDLTTQFKSMAKRLASFLQREDFLGTKVVILDTVNLLAYSNFSHLCQKWENRIDGKLHFLQSRTINDTNSHCLMCQELEGLLNTRGLLSIFNTEKIGSIKG